MEFSIAYLSGKGNRAAGMRLLVARCEVRYTGRLTTAVRFLGGYRIELIEQS
jgi:RecB family endonuclease NucS